MCTEWAGYITGDNMHTIVTVYCITVLSDSWFVYLQQFSIHFVSAMQVRSLCSFFYQSEVTLNKNQTEWKWMKWMHEFNKILKICWYYEVVGENGYKTLILILLSDIYTSYIRTMQKKRLKKRHKTHPEKQCQNTLTSTHNISALDITYDVVNTEYSVD